MFHNAPHPLQLYHLYHNGAIGGAPRDMFLEPCFLPGNDRILACVGIQSTEKLNRLEMICGFSPVSLSLALGTKPGEGVLRREGVGAHKAGTRPSV